MLERIIQDAVSKARRRVMPEYPSLFIGMDEAKFLARYIEERESHLKKDRMMKEKRSSIIKGRHLLPLAVLLEILRTDSSVTPFVAPYSEAYPHLLYAGREPSDRERAKAFLQAIPPYTRTVASRIKQLKLRPRRQCTVWQRRYISPASVFWLPTKENERYIRDVLGPHEGSLYWAMLESEKAMYGVQRPWISYFDRMIVMDAFWRYGSNLAFDSWKSGKIKQNPFLAVSGATIYPDNGRLAVKRKEITYLSAQV